MLASLKRFIIPSIQQLDRFQLNNQEIFVETISSQTGDTPQSPMLLIGLHGYGMDEHQIKTLINLDLDFPHIYIALRGFFNLEDGGQAWFPIQLVNDHIQAKAKELRQSLDLLAEFIPTAVKYYHANPTNVYILGYSQGGNMSLSFALTHPELIAGAVVLSGSLLEDIKPWMQPANTLQSNPLFIGHGTRDDLVSADHMREVEGFLRSRNIAVTYQEYSIPHVVSREQRQDVAHWLAKQHSLKSVFK